MHESTPVQTGKKQASSSGAHPARTLPKDDFPTPVEVDSNKPLISTDFSEKLDRFRVMKNNFVNIVVQLFLKKLKK